MYIIHGTTIQCNDMWMKNIILGYLHSMLQTGNRHFEHLFIVGNPDSLCPWFPVNIGAGGFKHSKQTAADLLLGPHTAGASSRIISPAWISLVATITFPISGCSSIQKGRQTKPSQPVSEPSHISNGIIRLLHNMYTVVEEVGALVEMESAAWHGLRS